MTDEPIACSLTGGGQAARIREWQRLLAGATRRRVDGGLTIRVAAASAGRLAELAVAEQECCPFFGFTLRFLGETVELVVRAPAEAEPLLADVFGA